jgi:hypothetical protein
MKTPARNGSRLYGSHLGRAHLIFRRTANSELDQKGEMLSSLLIQLGVHRRYLKKEADGNEMHSQFATLTIGTAWE